MKSLSLFICSVMAQAGILCSAHAQRTGPLFDGKTLDGWTTTDGSPVTRGWKTVDGTIHLLKNAGAGNIVTAKEYGDFDLRFEWKISKGGNSGIKYRVRRFGKRVLGCEYQILDDGGHPDGQTPKKSSGSLFDVYAPNTDKHLKPAGEYNSSRIVVRGDHVERWLNEDLILSMRLARPMAATKTLVDGCFKRRTRWRPGV